MSYTIKLPGSYPESSSNNSIRTQIERSNTNDVASKEAPVRLNPNAKNPFFEAVDHVSRTFERNSKPFSSSEGVRVGVNEVKKNLPFTCATIVANVAFNSVSNQGLGKSLPMAATGVALQALHEPALSLFKSSFAGAFLAPKDYLLVCEATVRDVKDDSKERLAMRDEDEKRYINNSYKKMESSIEILKKGKVPNEDPKSADAIMANLVFVQGFHVGAPVKFHDYQANFSKKNETILIDEYPTIASDIKSASDTLRTSSHQSQSLESVSRFSNLQHMFYGPGGTGKTTLCKKLSTSVYEIEPVVVDRPEYYPADILGNKNPISNLEQGKQSVGAIELEIRQQDYLNVPVILNDIQYDGRTGSQAMALRCFQSLFDRGHPTSKKSEGNLNKDAIHWMVTTNDFENMEKDRSIQPFLDRLDLTFVGKPADKMFENAANEAIDDQLKQFNLNFDQKERDIHALRSSGRSVPKEVIESHSHQKTAIEKTKSLLKENLPKILESNNKKNARQMQSVIIKIVKDVYLSVYDGDIGHDQKKDNAKVAQVIQNFFAPPIPPRNPRRLQDMAIKNGSESE